MPKVQIFDMAGNAVSELELAGAVFGIEPNQVAVHACVVNYLANQRQGTQSTLTRSEVRGGGRKPVRAPSAPPSGAKAASRWAPSPAATATPSTASSNAWPSSRSSPTWSPTTI